MHALQNFPVADLAWIGGGLPQLGEDEIHVWSLYLPGAARTVAAAARAAMLRMLGIYAGRLEPLFLERGPHGKPYAPDLPWLQFNLSHAGSHVLLAFARKQAIGVDIEAVDRSVRVDEVARRFFAASEADVLQALPADQRTRAFVQLWTRKEAVLKAIGEGIGFGLEKLEFALTASGDVGALRRIAAQGGTVAHWHIQSLPTAAGTTGALAWHGPPRRVRTGVLDATTFGCDAPAPPVV